MSLSKPHGKPRFKDWLVYVLDNDLCHDDARWRDSSRRTAIIRWPHKSRGTWSLEKDAKLLKMWAIASGKYRRNVDAPNPRSWKCNFRMNLNICKNITELKHERVPKGPNACRVFAFTDRRSALPLQFDCGDCSTNNANEETDDDVETDFSWLDDLTGTECHVDDDETTNNVEN